MNGIDPKHAALLLGPLLVAIISLAAAAFVSERDGRAIDHFTTATTRR